MSMLSRELALQIQDAVKCNPAPTTLEAGIALLLADHEVWDKHSLTVLVTENAALREQVAQLTGERDAFIQGGVTEELLRTHDGYIKVGRGCALVLEEEREQLLDQIAMLIRTHDAYVSVAEAHEQVLTRERDRYKELLEKEARK